MRGMDISGAVHTYSVLTIGDSLVSQMPAFLIAIASGILVTKATSKSSLGQELGTQFLSNPKPLASASAFFSVWRRCRACRSCRFWRWRRACGGRIARRPRR